MAPPPKKQRRLREPDVSFWGESKFERDEDNTQEPKSPNPPAFMNPDVVIIFGWRNSMAYEIGALNDIMNRSGSFSNDTYPRIGYLIRPRFGEAPGFDIYKVPQDRTFSDAENNIKGATHSVYTVGGADVVIKITPSDLGMPAAGIWGYIRGMLCGDFEISMEQLYKKVNPK
jgi:hypothetical protein